MIPRPVLFGVPVGAIIMFMVFWMGGSLTAVIGDGLPDAETGQAAAEEVPPKPTWPTIQDVDPADWYECMDRAFELSNVVHVIYANGTSILGNDLNYYTESTTRVANMAWYIAVCDRMFPVDP